MKSITKKWRFFMILCITKRLACGVIYKKGDTIMSDSKLSAFDLFVKKVSESFLKSKEKELCEYFTKTGKYFLPITGIIYK